MNKHFDREDDDSPCRGPMHVPYWRSLLANYSYMHIIIFVSIHCFSVTLREGSKASVIMMTLRVTKISLEIPPD